MSWIEIFLNRIEARLRLLVEGDSAGDGFPRRLHRQLEVVLIRAMKTNIYQSAINGDDGKFYWVAPDEYTVILPSAEAELLLSHPAEIERLTRKLETTISQLRISITVAPIIRVVADPDAMSLSVRVDFCRSGEDDSSTYQMVDDDRASDLKLREKMPNAYLIVNGLSTFLITEPLINIGRDPSNQLQLNDAQVSHKHAQLRFIQDRFVIFDLDSQGGTFVNGVPVSRRALNPGDVILLARLPLVFGQEIELSDGQTQELPVTQPPPEVL